MGHERTCLVQRMVVAHALLPSSSLWALPQVKRDASPEDMGPFLGALGDYSMPGLVQSVPLEAALKW